MLCVKECPTWCIELDSHPEQIEEPGARPRTVNALDDFRIDYGLCMYCGICIEVCPFDALEWKPDYDYAGQNRDDVIHDLDTLEHWRFT
jgi:NADH-quinone oxidoreductase subunit I